MSPRRVGLGVIGGGPAGLGVLLAASRDGMLDALLAEGVAIVDRRPTIGSGGIGAYAIRSDSAAGTILSCLEGVRHDRLLAVRSGETARAIEAHGSGPVALGLIARFLDEVGAVLAEMVSGSGRGLVLTGHEATVARRVGRHLWRVSLHEQRTCIGREFGAARLLIACGGIQDQRRLARERLFGKLTLLPRWQGKVMMSDVLLTPEGIETARLRLSGRPQSRALVLGGSTSAFAAARVLIERVGAGSATLLHRGRLRLFYGSASAALADGYDEFGPDDICPVSGFVHRLGGLRFDAADLLREQRNGHGAGARLAILDGGGLTQGELASRLDDADLVVASLGYRPRGLALRDRSGAPLRIVRDERRPMVDDRCRVLDAAGEPVPGVLGLGLAAGPLTGGMLGGEPSFRGQTNSLWLWQHDLGSRLARALAGGSVAKTSAN